MLAALQTSKAGRRSKPNMESGDARRTPNIQSWVEVQTKHGKRRCSPHSKYPKLACGMGIASAMTMAIAVSRQRRHASHRGGTDSTALLRGLAPAPMPRFPAPMLCTLVAEAFDDDGWL